MAIFVVILATKAFIIKKLKNIHTKHNKHLPRLAKTSIINLTSCQQNGVIIDKKS